MVREKLLENIQAGLDDSIEKDNLVATAQGTVFYNVAALQDIAKHIEPFRQFSPAELEIMQLALYLFEEDIINYVPEVQANKHLIKPLIQEILDTLNLTNPNP